MLVQLLPTTVASHQWEYRIESVRPPRQRQRRAHELRDDTFTNAEFGSTLVKIPRPSAVIASDDDSPWKEAIGQHSQQFLEYFFPDIEADIDWSAG